jgi:deoxyadenosine/deoxycytidine kinase
MERPLYIAVEGPIGVGKTTLVHRLAERLEARLVREVVEENPFLPLFYTDRDRYAFQTQIFFLMSRFKQQEELKQPDLFRPNTLADYHLLKDRIFARLTLRDEELALYERVYRSLESQILKPDVLVVLTARLPVLLERIARRGRPFEKDFDADYLEGLVRGYQDALGTYAASPVLRLDTSDLDTVTDDRTVDAILAEIRTRSAQRRRGGWRP